MVRRIACEVYDNLEKYFCAFLTVLMVFCLGAQVFFRFVLNASLTWSEELSRFAFVWLVYMGATLGAKERIHIRVTAPQLLLPVSWRRFVSLVADLVWVAVNLVFAYQGVIQVKHLIQYSYISPALQWNMAYIYSVVPAGFVLMSYRIIEGHVSDYRRGGLAALAWTSLPRGGAACRKGENHDSGAPSGHVVNLPGHRHPRVHVAGHRNRGGSFRL